MTFALPWVFGVAVAAAMVVTALHLLSVRRPPEFLLPTTRFLPDRDVRAVSRTRRPSDVWLLLARVLLLLLAGLAIAQPRWKSSARTGVRLVIVGPGILRDTAAITAHVMRDARRVDDATMRVALIFADSSMTGADLTALFPLAMRSAAELAQGDVTLDSLELHVLTAEPGIDDRAAAAWRAAWDGRVVVHRPREDASVDARRGREVVLVDARGNVLRDALPGSTDDVAVILSHLQWSLRRLLAPE